MILQALCEYYDRKARAGEIESLGFEKKAIPFVILLNNSGEVQGLNDMREQVKGKLVPKTFQVPQSVGRSGSASWKTAFLLWDHYGYVLGYPKANSGKERKKRHQLLCAVSGRSDDTEITEWVEKEVLLDEFDVQLIEKIMEKLQLITSDDAKKDVQKLEKSLQSFLKNINDAQKQLGSFVAKINSLPSEVKQAPAVSAVIKFYETEQYRDVWRLDNWMDCTNINGANLTFQLAGEIAPVVSCPQVIQFQSRDASVPVSGSEQKQRCMVSGNLDYIERLHTATPVWGGQAGGKLIGFQKNSGFDSYGKEQAFNAPVGMVAQFAYSTALNTLLKSEQNRLFVGNSTIIFWSDKQNVLEQTMSNFFVAPKDDPDSGTRAVKQFLESVHAGKITTDSQKRFYVLSLSPNAARVAVNSWMTGTVADFSAHIVQHFHDLKIDTLETEVDYFPLISLLSATALDYKMDNVAPNLSSQVVTAVLQGLPYPPTLLHAVIRRIRAEQSKKKNGKLIRNVTHKRAAIIKACINRYNRFYNKTEEELKVSLDVNNTHPAYLLGRLFAVLEKIQYRALGIETIRERYYGAFSSSPVTVYPQLMKLKNHHVAKLEKGKRFFEDLIAEIVNGLPGSGEVPRQLTLNDQGRFAVGYYHQRYALNSYKSKDNNNETAEEEIA